MKPLPSKPLPHVFPWAPPKRSFPLLLSSRLDARHKEKMPRRLLLHFARKGVSSRLQLSGRRNTTAHRGGSFSASFNSDRRRPPQIDTLQRPFITISDSDVPSSTDPCSFIFIFYCTLLLDFDFGSELCFSMWSFILDFDVESTASFSLWSEV
ncbi:hypothetical protein E2542_SST06840 [Spatholobus suberectus]|nr:hypothetical protein E2542_SST06840 [Spatholobus suberectus]